MKTIKLTGKVLWWNKRDGNGIVKDVEGFEFYIDTSVLIPRKLAETLKSGIPVSFILNERIKDCRCGMNVRVVKC